MIKVLITGANGFIGNAIISKLVSDNKFILRASVRKLSRSLPLSVELIKNMSLNGASDWSSALNNIDVVIHCAAHVHKKNNNSVRDFEEINTAGTLSLAKQAASCGVSRFIFLSSIGVNGSQTYGVPFKADDKPNPDTLYAKSKFNAEQGLMKISALTRMNIVIIRPPLVYGPNAPGNFLTLLNFMRWRIPLPLGAVINKRSFVFIENLVDLIICCIDHPRAANQIFLVSDDHDMSTTQFLKHIRRALNVSIFLPPVPMVFLSKIALFTGNSKIATQLLGSLEIDIKKTKKLLNWEPIIDINKAFDLSIKNFS
jgi:nucleoside-diphosphate-sugar epimerase